MSFFGVKRPDEAKRAAFLQSHFDYLSKGEEAVKRIGHGILDVLSVIDPVHAAQIQGAKQGVDDVTKEFEKMVSKITGGRLKASSEKANDPLFTSYDETSKRFHRDNYLSKVESISNSLNRIQAPTVAAPHEVSSSYSPFVSRDSGVSQI